MKLTGPVLSDEFAASAEASPAAGLEAASPADARQRSVGPPVPSTVDHAPAVGGTGHVWLRADQVAAGDVVVPRYGHPYVVQSTSKRMAGLIQIRSTEGACRLFVLPETQVLVRA